MVKHARSVQTDLFTVYYFPTYRRTEMTVVKNMFLVGYNHRCLQAWAHQGIAWVDNAPGVVDFIKIRFHYCRKSNKVSSEGSFACLARAHDFFCRCLWS